MADQEPPSFMKELGQDIVTVHIGPEKIPFIVHKDLLTQCSPYFKAAFEGNFCEALENSIPLIDISTTQFRLFLDWLYFRRLPNQSQKLGLAGCMNCKPTGVRCSNATGDSDEPQIELLSSDDEQRLEDLIETGPWYKEMLYVLADRCDVPVLRKLLINQEWASRQHTPRSFAPVIYALRKLPSKSPWNKLSIDVYSELYEARQDVVYQTEVLLRQKLPQEFLVAVMCSLSEFGKCDEDSINACARADKVRN
ncbi:hypothetical protein E2P81_ATG01624 [Venturia nashicola]|nr:hypothetical protein E2P81_ATG01624 [Venturia nashicola]